jgi:pimeloyl-ACP methyl ester carboxylesterase
MAAATPQTEPRFLELGGRRLEYVDLPARHDARPALVLLHEGLGCVEMWRDLPSLLASATGCRTVAYSRWGYGRSDGLDGPRTPRYLHDEALLWLPELRAALGLERVVLVGHSDGASIALVHAGADQWPVAALVAIAPHEFVEEVTVEGIRAAGEAWRTTDLAARLRRYHRDADGVFAAWHDTWLSAAFRAWNIEEFLPGIRCPLLAIQGEQDEYATMAQLDAIVRGATRSPRAEQMRLEGCGHAPHRERADEVVAAIARLVDAAPEAKDDSSQ